MAQGFAPVTLVTPRLVVATPTAADAGPIADYQRRNRDFHAPTASPWVEGFDTEAWWAQRIREQESERAARSALRFVLKARGGDGRVLGAANFNAFVWGAFRACYLGYALDREAEGQGLMFEALTAALEHVFREVRAHRVMANHLPDNARSARLLERLGFLREGYARDYLFIAGAWRDHVLTAKTSPFPVTPDD